MKNFIVSTFITLGLLSSITTFAAEGDAYDFSWLDPDKEVFVLQNRKFRKAGRLHANLGYGFTTSGAFVDASAFQGRAGYFFKEELGVEFVYSLNSGAENDTATSIRNPGGAGSFPFRRIVDNYMGAMFLWSPFYNKINTFNKIVYMDWILGLGFAKVEETNNQNEILTSGGNTTLTTESHTGIMWDIGAKFYLNEMWSLRIDLNAINYKAMEAKSTNATEQWYSNYDLTVAVGINF
ncbi:outer membrane beta-barrel domain-containing protein [Halobacteriovorax sp. HLS]|uniref:outer membrane beta-barrel domain-containing protein n=1 Tax=Halobacteriovorax sp. HLS TaxID=2234000 RepID=UPI0013E33431|nr:outer membrane beta-barrel domain-containing protein [Halobacteriovorax sp. HLS]